MKDIDAVIREALDEEDHAVLSQFREQGLMAQFFGVYTGPQAPFIALVTVVMVVVFGFGAYAAWRFVEAGGGEGALGWALCAVTALFAVSFMKIWFWIRMESNRVIREIKRLELQIARQAEKAV